MKILDCTLRDGGYYTNWDFDDKLVDAYIEAMNALPIDYLELGYRSLPSNEYLGKFGYTPVSVLKRLRQQCTKKLCVMLNEKSTHSEHLPELLGPIVGMVDMVRIAIDLRNFDRALILAKVVKDMGFEVGFNTMYMSKWKETKGFLNKLDQLNGVVDLFCMVDSFGGVLPNDVREITRMVKAKTTCPIGFHGHNNLQMGLVNSLTAIEEGCEYVDATILGMGRGAGNLNMELLLTHLAKEKLDVDFNVLGDVIEAFKPLYEQHQWGTNLPYMISGAYSIPQKEVMDWVGNRAYSFNSIVRALDNKRNKVADNARFPIWHASQLDRGLIIGGGPSVIEHKTAIREFLIKNPDIVLIFATARHATLFNDLVNSKIYCLVGNEAKRMKKNVSAEQFHDTVILPPYPRTMGTEVPEYAEQNTYELPEIAFTKVFLDSCTTTALKVAIEHKISSTYIVGYDGYRGGILSDKEMELSIENRTLFEAYNKFTGVPLISLTPTLYKSLLVKSIYQFI